MPGDMWAQCLLSPSAVAGMDKAMAPRNGAASRAMTARSSRSCPIRLCIQFNRIAPLRRDIQANRGSRSSDPCRRILQNTPGLCPVGDLPGPAGGAADDAGRILRRRHLHHRRDTVCLSSGHSAKNKQHAFIIGWAFAWAAYRRVIDFDRARNRQHRTRGREPSWPVATSPAGVCHGQADRRGLTRSVTVRRTGASSLSGNAR